MSRHVSYRGATIDMDSMRRENEKVPAIGNMKVNARGDQISNGMVTKTADQIARERHRVQSTIVNTGLKGPMLPDPAPAITPPKQAVAKTTTVATPKTKEVELPSGDIVIEEDKDAN